MQINDILTTKFPECDFRKDIVLQEDGAGIYIAQWNLDIPKPSKEQLDQWAIEIALDYEIKTIRQKRQAAYPPVDVQLDMQYHDLVDGTTTWPDMIQQIKLQYPMPEGTNEE